MALRMDMVLNCQHGVKDSIFIRFTAWSIIIIFIPVCVY